MLYILLIIIAVGVLLISEAGKKLLGFFIALFFICCLLFLGFLIIFGGISLLLDKSIRDSIFTVLGVVMLGSYAIYKIYSLHKKYKQGKLTKEIIKNKTFDWIKVSWKKSKIIFIGCALLVFLLLTALTMSLIGNNF